MRFPVILFISILLGALGQLTLKIGADQLTQFKLNFSQLAPTMLNIFSNPWVITGTILYAASMLTWLKVLSTTELSLAYPMASLGYILVLIFSYLFLGESLSLSKLIGIMAVVSGVVLIGRG